MTRTKSKKEVSDVGSPQTTNLKAKQLSDHVWEIPITEKKGMQAPAKIYSSKKLFPQLDAGVFDQITNVACLPGIVQNAIAMPDAHWGYGSPVGGVAAFDTKEGIISPGVIGFDINCGMRLLTTNLTAKEVQPKIKELVNDLFDRVPTGVGKKGSVSLNPSTFREVMEQGAEWCVANNLAWKEDIEKIEEQGKLKKADSNAVSEKAIKRGIGQLGTLGSGNHYLEVQVVHAEEIYDAETAKAYGIHSPDQIVIMIHCGSRGFGHQVATDYLNTFEPAMRKYKITVPDRQLACAPFASEEGQSYYKAMACAANNAYANRQVITHKVRESFAQVFGNTAESMEMHVTYDVSHNIAKEERHKIEGKTQNVLVHRKGATRSFGPGFLW